MDSNKILEGNKLIADFMEVATFMYADMLCYAEYDGPESIKYDDSWSWLMPVIEKIESIYDEHHGYFGVHISSNSCIIQGTNIHKAIKNLTEYGPVYLSDTNAVFPTKIESTWYNVVEFIKWYNNNPSIGE